ncbi:MAG: dynamin family protein [Acidimicrobiales bacterium]|nr:dynamin family protein [Acidimicrobiales bacterium]
MATEGAAGAPEAGAPAPSPPPERAVLALGLKAATAYGRPDLAERLAGLAARVEQPEVRVLVVGEFKQGKSSLVNALVGSDLCPVDDDIATSAPLLLRWAATPVAAVRLRAGPADATDGAEDAGDDGAAALDPAEVADWVTERANPGNRRHVALVELGVPAPLLSEGLVVVDTPGVGGLGSTHGAVTAAALPLADAVVFVGDAAQELTGAEAAFLQTCVRLCPTIAYALTKTDLHPAWRRIAEIDAGHLATLGLGGLPLLPVSATLARLAEPRHDQRLAVESGLPVLRDWLTAEVLGGAATRRRRSVAAEVAAVADQLAARFEAERATLADPEHAARVLAELQDARQRAEQLRGAAGRWQQGLADGFGDLTADVEHDLRSRLRDVGREADEALERCDPALAWAEFEPWLRQRTAAAVTASYALLHERATALAIRLGEAFDVDEQQVSDRLRVGPPDDALALAPRDGALEARRAGVGAMALTALRGGYSGSSMFGMLGGMAGLALAPPVAVLAVVAFGAKTVRDERTRQLAQRRTQARTAARRYLDEVTFSVSKDLRDVLRRVQRTLRDLLASRAEELARSAQEAAAAAQGAAQAAAGAGGPGREQRLADVEAELRRIGGLRRQALDLVEAAP